MTVLPVRTAISLVVHSREFRVVGCPDWRWWWCFMSPQTIAEMVPCYSLWQPHSKPFPAYNELIL